MCGLFGFSGPSPAQTAELTIIATLAATRGPHSHGFAWLNGDGINSHRGWGDARRAIPTLQKLETTAIIGHSRLATTGLYAGGPPGIDDTMPFVVGDGERQVAVVHNGTLRGYRVIARQAGFNLTSGCDSEVIAHLILRTLRTAPTLPLSALLSIVSDQIDEGNPFAVIAMDHRGQTAAVRRGLPLFAGNGDEGTYLCSRAFTGSVKLRDGYVWGWPSFTARRETADETEAA